MLPREYRLTKSADFRRVYTEGQSWFDRMVVLCKAPNGLTKSRFGFSTSRRIGDAVVRNRTKRLMREAVRLMYDLISPGWDVVFIARQAIAGADYHAVKQSITHHLQLARMLRPSDGVVGGQED